MSEAENDWTRVGSHVEKRVIHLQEGYLKNTAAAVSDLARLRRGIAIPLGRDLELIGLTGLPELGDGWMEGPPRDIEHAAYAAIVLYASHQQSHRGTRMHQRGYSFGRSARLLGRHTNAWEAVRRRFNAAGTAQGWDETTRHVRGLIQQFRSEGIPLDYERFARDLLGLRLVALADHVRLGWARDFYRTNHAEDDASPDGPPPLDAAAAAAAAAD